MQGIPDFNFPMFTAVAEILRRKGHEVFNPAEKDIERHAGVDMTNKAGSVEQAIKEHKFSLRDALGEDTDYICKHAEGIVLLPGWEHSNGALAEFYLARALSKVYPFRFVYVQTINTLLHVPIENGTFEKEAA